MKRVLSEAVRGLCYSVLFVGLFLMADGLRWDGTMIPIAACLSMVAFVGVVVIEVPELRPTILDWIGTAILVSIYVFTRPFRWLALGMTWFADRVDTLARAAAKPFVRWVKS